MSVKFRNPKTGKVFENVVAFRGDFCCEYSCDICPIMKVGKTSLCEKWINEHPYETAKAIGYEVIENTNENKPLKDWTLNELKEYCKDNIRKNCDICPFTHNCNEIIGALDNEKAIPYHWLLSQHYTKEEIKFAKFLKNYVDNPESIIIKRYENGNLSWIDMKTHKSYDIPKELFVSIKNNTQTKLIDITNDGE